MLSSFLEWVKFGPNPHVGIFLCLLTGIVMYVLYLCYQTFYRKRLIEDLPTSRIQSAAQGYIELEGKAKLMGGTPIIAPLSGIKCAWYYFRVEEQSSDGKHSNWSVTNSGTSDELFLLDDGTGECVIDPDNANVTPNVKDIWYGNSGASSPMIGSLPRAPKFRTGTAYTQYKYTEHRIEIDAPLYTVGFFHSLNDGGAADINADIKELLIEWKRDSDRLLQRFDKNKDGEIDMQEWQDARKAAYEEVTARHRDLASSLPTHMLEQTKDRRKPFIISAKPQSDFIKQLNQEFYIKAAISVFLGVLVVFLIQLRLSNGISTL